jgi:hypothetical protein
MPTKQNSQDSDVRQGDRWKLAAVFRRVRVQCEMSDEMEAVGKGKVGGNGLYR